MEKTVLQIEIERWEKAYKNNWGGDRNIIESFIHHLKMALKAEKKQLEDAYLIGMRDGKEGTKVYFANLYNKFNQQ